MNRWSSFLFILHLCLGRSLWRSSFVLCRPLLAGPCNYLKTVCEFQVTSCMSLNYCVSTYSEIHGRWGTAYFSQIYKKKKKSCCPETVERHTVSLQPPCLQRRLRNSNVNVTSIEVNNAKILFYFRSIMCFCHCCGQLSKNKTNKTLIVLPLLMTKVDAHPSPFYSLVTMSSVFSF